MDLAAPLMTRLHDAIRLDLSALRQIPFEFAKEVERSTAQVVLLMDRLARDIIHAVAQNGAELWSVEWRILEHVLARAFEGLGFDAELTPSSKDGGKDIILTCMERGSRKQYAVEIKHWVAGKRVGAHHLRKFLDVLVTEKHDAGLFLSTSGYASGPSGDHLQLEHRRLRVAGAGKVVDLCRMFVLGESGVWLPGRTPTGSLFDGTLEAHRFAEVPIVQR